MKSCFRSEYLLPWCWISEHADSSEIWLKTPLKKTNAINLPKLICWLLLTVVILNKIVQPLISSVPGYVISHSGNIEPSLMQVFFLPEWRLYNFWDKVLNGMKNLLLVTFNCYVTQSSISIYYHEMPKSD